MSPQLHLVDGDRRLADVVDLDSYRKARASVARVPRPKPTNGDAA